jgi:uncharacterized protein with ParB-like and HNH nuclease domain
MNITPAKLDIGQLFRSNAEQFYIPAYQRRYSWGIKQISELYNDINTLDKEDAHLLGNVVCLTSEHGAGINKLELVDGQQRITSLSLFLKAIKDRFEELEDLEAVSEIETYLYAKDLNRKTQNKLLLGDLDNPDYIKLIKLQHLDDIKNRNMLENYRYILKLVTQLTIEELNLLYYKLTNNVFVIRLDIGNAKDAYKLFETINNRGMNLSATDIIKNFLLGQASSIDEETLQEVRENWKQVIVNLDNIKIDDFFRQLMCSILGKKVTQSALIDEFKSYYSSLRLESDEASETVINFSQKINTISKIYAMIHHRSFDNSLINQHLFNLQRIESFPSYIFLLNLFQREGIDDKTIINILRTIEVFMIRRTICAYRTGELDIIFSKLSKLENHELLQQIKIQLQKELPSDLEFESKFLLSTFGNKKNRAKYILEIFEYDLIESKNEYRLTSGNELHLEHIIPQSINTKKSLNEFGDWMEYLGEHAEIKHKEYVNRIGNYTLLGQELNIKASNNPFKSKLEQYQQSNIALTKEIVEKYLEFRFEEIENRSLEMSQRVCDLWNFETI